MRDQHKQQTGLTKKQGELDINPNNYALKITNKYGCLQTKDNQQMTTPTKN